MIFLLFFAIYISISCWALGHCLLRLGKNNQRWQASLIVPLLAGLCSYSFIAGYWTLLLPTGTGLQHLFISAFTIKYLALHISWPKVWVKIQQGFVKHKAVAALVAALALLLLMMGSWEITHPDTLGYHAGIMSWIDGFRVIPGLANLQLRLGYQGQWFPLCTFFAPHFFSPALYSNILNITVCFWYLLFIGERVAMSDRNGQKAFWLILLIASFCSYTQIRLTATSASPDFIATILAWWVVYEIYNYNHSYFEQLILSSIAVTAISFKLSAIVICLIVAGWVFQYIYKKSFAKAGVMIALCIMLMQPFFIRNVISTGYLAFPVPQFAISALPWTVPTITAQHDQGYIKAYARARVDYDKQIIEEKNQQSFWQWMPYWWQMQSLADKIILLFSLAAVCFSFLRIRSWSKASPKHAYLFAVLGIGVLFWFNQAPDPRFGFVYIVPLAAMAVLSNGFANYQGGKHVYQALLFACICLCLLYTGYRCYRFFNREQLMNPQGITNPNYDLYPCKGINWIKPREGSDCKGLKAPCLQAPCDKVVLRGTKITDGFLPAQ